MSGFPSLQPAFTIQANIDAPFQVGSASRGTSLQVVPMTGGSLKSAPGFSPNADSEFVGVGNDYIKADGDGKHVRLNAHGVLKTHDGALLYVNYTGVVALGPAEVAVFSGTAEDGATPYGNSSVNDDFANHPYYTKTTVTHFTFETGDERYKELENRVFAGQGHFITQKGKPTVVEYKVGQVVEG